MIKITREFKGTNMNVFTDDYKTEIEQIAGMKWDEIDKKFTVIFDTVVKDVVVTIDGVGIPQNPLMRKALELGDCDGIAIPVGTTAWITIEF